MRGIAGEEKNMRQGRMKGCASPAFSRKTHQGRREMQAHRRRI